MKYWRFYLYTLILFAGGAIIGSWFPGLKDVRFWAVDLCFIFFMQCLLKPKRDFPPRVLQWHCWVWGGHIWPDWKYYPAQYGDEAWQERTCVYCERHETKVLD